MTTPARDECLQAAMQAVADHFGDDWEQVKTGFGAAANDDEAA